MSSSNLGDNRTLAIPVAHTIFWEMGPERRAEMGIVDGLIRVSVGIEDRDDLIADFTQALAASVGRLLERAIRYAAAARSTPLVSCLGAARTRCRATPQPSVFFTLWRS